MRRVKTTAYNLEVEELHDYAVGQVGILVHNSSAEELARLKQAAAECADRVKRYRSKIEEIEQGLKEIRDGTRTVQPGVTFDPVMVGKQFHEYFSQLLTKEQAVLDGHLKQIGKLLALD